MTECLSGALHLFRFMEGGKEFTTGFVFRLSSAQPKSNYGAAARLACGSEVADLLTCAKCT